MDQTIIDNVTLVPGNGAEPLRGATVVLDADGVVSEIAAGKAAGSPDAERFLVPAGVDLHLDNLTERRRPRATVRLDQAAVLSVLDAECAAAGIGTVCIAARCEDAPGKGVMVEDAVELAAVVEALAPSLSCDWRIHARVEVTDDAAIDSLRAILQVSSRVAVVSVMEHSIERSRFASAAEHRAFYAADWGLPLEEVDRILAEKADGGEDREARRQEVAALSRAAGIVLASHDDRSPEDVEAAYALGARIAEFPLTMAAALRARELGMATVLGSPNAVRGKSTSPGNLLVAEAVANGACEVLCSDYLPLALQSAPHALVQAGAASLAAAVDLVSTAPAAAIGLPSPAIEIGKPLTAALGIVAGTTFMGSALWRDGRQTFARTPATARLLTPSGA
ncbi:alpha-D-ribose 1-methylphosphonate 5-triphosphate diphosphatase [Arthrobacter sulfonylureivorans]|uniref:Alpha-D-ribose 1-methylphosphonate 5-triphosphate diphosphatase n=1 Tax=Arthrobacter sulfonylureivorans TaxID=2486855 RepID=A0ABY3WBX2_9MICC|nr:alpha-D-ribose 1-methylphosphonate 5-triphosphate diphosphatase [Arthrobacter sulfonylureivorans]UNK47820.1 alpha-D-ribose 1-methylphosphonate 5-triphosphate diphosphatase [Arthrobacter sulfonylureivorans]